MTQFSEIQQKLEARLDTIRQRTAKVERTLRRERHHDSQERAQDAENDEVLERLDEGGLDEIEAIENALERIKLGTYGICAGCQEPIAVARLQAVPFAHTCIDCAK